MPESYCMPTRFPSPLIKPDVPVSSIRLSDRSHQLAHGGNAQCYVTKTQHPQLPEHRSVREAGGAPRVHLATSPQEMQHAIIDVLIGLATRACTTI